MKFDHAYLERSLKDCGFEKDSAAQYIKYAKKSRTADLLRLLNWQRKKLMDNLHAVQRSVDTIDFLICSVENNKKGELS